MVPSDDRPSSTALSASHSEPLALLTRAGIAVIGLTSTGRIVTATDALEDLTGYTHTELWGRHSPISFQRFPLRSRPSFTRPLQKGTR